MDVHIVVCRIYYTACNVGAVVSCSFEVCKKVRPYKANLDGAVPLLKADYVAAAHLLFESVNNLLKRLNLLCSFKVIFKKRFKGKVDDFFNCAKELFKLAVNKYPPTDDSLEVVRVYEELCNLEY